MRTLTLYNILYSWIGRPIRADKNQLLGNRKGYDTSETTIGKLSARRIQIWLGYFCLGIILKVIQYNFQNNVQTKIAQLDLNSPRRELSNGGLGIVVTLLVAYQINYSCASAGSAIQL